MEKELLVQGQFYYHPFLQEGPPAPTFSRDPFQSVRTRAPFYLRMKTSCTLIDLIRYFREKMPGQLDLREADIKGMEYFLRMCQRAKKPMNAIDLALFTIDQAKIICDNDSREYPLTAFQLTNYIDDGFSRYEEKINIMREAGIDKTIEP